MRAAQREIKRLLKRIKSKTFRIQVKFYQN